MSLKIKCSQCKRQLTVTAAMSGRKAKCAGCGLVFQIPEISGNPPSQPVSTAPTVEPAEALPRVSAPAEDPLWDDLLDLPGQCDPGLIAGEPCDSLGDSRPSGRSLRRRKKDVPWGKVIIGVSCLLILTMCGGGGFLLVSKVSQAIRQNPTPQATHQVEQPVDEQTDESVGVTRQDGIVLCYAVEQRDADKIQELLAAGADVDARVDGGFTPLHAAALFGYAEIVRILIDAGADVEVKDDSGSTPLHQAAMTGDPLPVQMLLEAGANARAELPHGLTPLHFAVGYNNRELIEALLDAGADVQAETQFGVTPLYRAAIEGKGVAIQILLKSGADIEAKVAEKGTALHTAARKGVVEAVEALLDGGADVNAKDGEGKTPLDVAEDETVRSLLRSHGE